jgi:hypothetical protein
MLALLLIPPCKKTTVGALFLATWAQVGWPWSVSIAMGPWY